MLPKRNFSLLTLLLSFACAGVALPASAEGRVQAQAPSKIDPRGQVLALSCAGCHGTDGKSASVIPSIYGKSPEYIESAMKDFKSGARVSTVMSRHAKGYSDEDIHLIAEYFGAISRKTNKSGGRQ